MAEISAIEQIVIDNVRKIRIELKYPQDKLSIDMGLNEKFIGHVESIRAKEKYNINHLNKIAELFNCSLRDFFPEHPIKGELVKRISKK